jgi:hypothetical protein
MAEREPRATQAVAGEAGRAPLGRGQQRALRQHRPAQHGAGAHLRPSRGVRADADLDGGWRSARTRMEWRCHPHRRDACRGVRPPGDARADAQRGSRARTARRQGGQAREGGRGDEGPPRVGRARAAASHRGHLVPRDLRAPSAERAPGSVGRGAQAPGRAAPWWRRAVRSPQTPARHEGAAPIQARGREFPASFFVGPPE